MRVRPLKQTDPPGEGERRQPVEAEGQRPTPLLAIGVQTESPQEAKTPECGTLPDFRAYRLTKG